MVYLDQLIHPDLSFYNIGCKLHVYNKFDFGLIKKSLEHTVAQLSQLRMHLVKNGDQVFQQVQSQIPVTLTVKDFREKINSRELANTYLQAFFEQPINLFDDVLWRATLVQISSGEYAFLLYFHHLVVDGIGGAVVYKSFVENYNRLAKGSVEAPLADDNYQVFIGEDLAYRASERYQRDLVFWKDQFDEVPDSLFSLRPHSGNKKQSSIVKSQRLSRSVYTQLQGVLSERGALTSNFFIALLSIYFAKTHNLSEVTIGVPVHNRLKAKFKATAGMFSSVIPLKVVINPSESFISLIQQISLQLKLIYRHQRFPVADINRMCQIAKLGRGQLYDISLSFEVFDGDFAFHNASHKVVRMQETSQQLPLGMWVMDWDKDDDIELLFNFNRSYIDDALADNLASRLLTMVESFVVNADVSISQLPVMTECERDHLLNGFSKAKVDFPRDKCIHELFEVQAQLNPNAIALVYEEQTLSYQELNKKSNQLAHYLISHGVVPDTLVGICVERSLEMVIGLLGILKAGGAYVPLDPSYPKDRLSYMLEDSGVEILLTQQNLLEQLPLTKQQTICIDTQTAYTNQAHTNIDVQDLGLKPNHLAYVIYTSGTTGNPKGVLVEHHNVIRLFTSSESYFDFNEHDVWTLFHSYAFDFSVWELWGALSKGGRLVVVPYWLARSSDEFYQLLEREQVTVLNQTPSAFNHLVLLDKERQSRLTLRYVIFGGETLDAVSIGTWFERHDDNSPQLFNMYGITETTVHVTCSLIDKKTIEEGVSDKTIGRPLDDLRVRILDAHGDLVPLGVAGELHVSGDGVARGYLNRVELTAEKFVSDPFNKNPKARLYKTGDLGSWNADGTLNYLGRNDDQVKIRGFRIELGEIESQLQKQERVQDALVMAYDEGDHKKLVAYLTPELNAKITSGDGLEETLDLEFIRSSLKASLPEFMIPSEIILLDEFPLTPNGKVDKKALPASDGSGLSRKTYEAPEGELEKFLADTWQDLLNVKNVGRWDNFFDLGGQSLLAVQIVSRIEERLSRTLTLKSIFDHPVLSDMAGELAKSEMHQDIAISHVDRSQTLPLSFAQKRLWLLDQIHVLGPAYNIPLILRFEGPLQLADVSRALKEIVNRHESLRTVFRQINGEPTQCILDPNTFVLPVIDLTKERLVEQDARVQSLALKEAQGEFDLSHDLMLRGTLLMLSKTRHVLLLTMHHIASDGWSLPILLNELKLLYKSYANGEPSPLPALSLQYADFASWQEKWLHEGVLEQQVGYWQEALDGAPAIHHLPMDYLRPAEQSYQGARVEQTLSSSLLKQLTQLAHTTGSTLFMVLETAFALLLLRRSGESDILIGTPTANRRHEQLSPLIGFFVNMLVLRTKIDGNPSFIELLLQAKDTAISAYENQSTPFDYLVEALQPVRSLAQHPLFQIEFALQNNTQLALNFDTAGVRVSANGIDTQSTKFDLSLHIWESEEGLKNYWGYSTDLFNASTIEYLAQEYEALLERIVEQPQWLVHDLCTPMVRIQTDRFFIASTFTSEPLAPYLQCLGEAFQRKVTIDFAPYHQVHQLLLDTHSGLYGFEAHKVLFIRWQDWAENTCDSFDQFFENGQLFLRYLENYLDIIADNTTLTIVECCSSFESSLNEKAKKYRKVLSQSLQDLAALSKGLSLLIMEDACELYHLNEYAAPNLESLASIPYTESAYAALAVQFWRHHYCAIVPPRKVIVLDCDHTLWRGVCGEVGALGVEIDHHYRDLQAFMLKQKQRGYVLALCSNNVREDVDAVFAQHPGMLLGKADVVAEEIDWRVKSDKIKSIAKTLNVGLDSLIFIDDDLVQCTQVRALCPEVHVVHLPQDESSRVSFLSRSWVFDQASNAPAMDRTQFYQDDQSRKGIASQVHSFKDFLERLQLNVVCRDIKESDYERLSEMTLRTNQFNFATQRYTVKNIETFLNTAENKGFCVEVQDRFGDYGTVGLALYKIENNVLIIEDFLLSCRALGRGVEHAMVRNLGSLCSQDNVKKLHFKFSKTTKNEPAERFYTAMNMGDELSLETALHCQPQDFGSQTETPLGEQKEQSKVSTTQITHSLRINEDQVNTLLYDLDSLQESARTRGAKLHIVGTSKAIANYVAPDTPLEKRLVEIWSDLLAVSTEQVGRDHNFFDLGGHSLLAVQLVSRIEQDLSKTLSLKSVFDAPILSEMARELAKGEVHQHHAITRVERDQALPVSWSQQRLWFIAQLDTQASRAYHIPASLRLSGVLNLEALERTFNTLLERHEVLRTSFVQNEVGEPIQVIHQDCAFALTHVDLSGLNKAEQNEQLVAQQEAETEGLFDLESGPLIRGRLLDLGLNEKDEPEYILLATMHHIVSDGWSMGIFTREISALYEAFSQGKPNPLEPLQIQYADYAHWQRSVLVDDALNQQFNYWQDQLSGAPELLSLPWDRPRPKQQDYRGGSVDIHLSAELTDKLNTLAKAKGMTLYMVLLSAWSMLLSRLSGQETVVIGTPVANRPRSELEGLIGFFVNTLAIRIDVDARSSLSSYLDKVKGRMLDAYDHQDMPFEQVVESIQPNRSLSHSALFQASFTFENTPAERELELSGLRLSSNESQHQEKAPFDLSLSLQETRTKDDGSIVGGLTYATALFDESTIRRWAEHFETLLRNLVDDTISLASRPVSRVSILTQEQRYKLLHEFNDTAVAYPKSWCIHELFERQVQASPSSIALVFEDQTLSYGQLNNKANQVAHYLVEQGVKPDSLVGICVERSLEMVIGLLGILKAGGAYVPLDSTYPEDRLKYMLEDSGVEILLTQQKVLKQLPTTHQQVICLDTQTAYTNQTHTNIDVQDLGLKPNHLAYVIYTSGTTGNPKGVMITRGGLSNYLDHAHKSYFTKVEGSVVSSSFSFDATVTSLLTPLLVGKKAILLREDKQELRALLTLITTAEHPLVFKITPSHLEGLRHGLDSGIISQLMHCFIVGGEAFPLHQALAWKRDLLPNAIFVNEYGPTETVVGCSIYTITDEKDFGKEVKKDKINVSIGRPIQNTQLYVLDEQKTFVPLGVMGEIYIGGAGIARGYLNRPELTSKKFIPNPFSEDPEARLYKTGDLGSWNTDGTLNYLGRNDDQVKIRGFRIELGEIESRLQSQENVQDALVMAYDEGDHKKLVAYLTSELNAKVTSVDGLEETLDLELIRSSLKASLPEYMIPSEMIVLDEFPLTSNGKIDRKALPAPDGSGLSRKAFEAPEGELEQTLAEIWQDLLKIKKVGRHDNFFDLGGHSLLAVQLVSRIEQGLSKTLSLKSLFDQPVLLDIANELAKGEAHQYRAIMRVERDQPLPVSWSQQRLWFIAQLDAQASRAYHISASLRLSGVLNLEALERTLNTLLERHEVLRTSFAQNEAGEPIQVIHQDCVFALTHVDLSGLNKDEQHERLAEQQEAEDEALFNLETGPLIRGRLIELGVSDKGEPEYILLATMHHIVSDGWSMGIFTREISTLYEAYSQGQSNPLEPLQIQYADYAHWQRSVLVGDALNQQLNYWQDQLSDAPELLSLPWDRPRPNQQDYRGGSVDIRLNAELTNKLNTLAKAKGMTLYMVLLSAWGVLLSRLSGQETVVIGTPVANRPRSELEGLIGFFVNTLAIRLDVNATANVSSYLDDVKGRTLGAYEHQDVPFEQVVEAIQPSRSLSHGPLYQTDFTFENVPEEGELTFSGVGLSDAHVNNEDEMAHSDLSLTLSELNVSSGRIIEGSLGYASALFDASTIARWSEYLLRLLEKIVETPDAKLCDLPMLSSAEREHLLVGVNQSTPLSLPQSHIHSVFEAQAERTPDATALAQEEESLSYRELNDNANRLAHYLRAQGLQTGALIGVYLPRSLDVFVSMLGIMKAGGAYVVLDPNHPLERTQQICHRANVSLVLSTQSFMPEGIELNSARSIFLDTPSFTDALSSQPKTNPGLILPADAPAFAYFTSGSTGVPKGALNSHEGAVNAMLAMAKELDLSEQDRVLQFAALGFDVVIEEVLPAWFSGAAVVLKDEEGLLSPAQLQQMLERNRITVCELMSSYWSHWVDYLCAQNIVPPGTLRTVMLGSDRVEMNAYSKWQSFNIPIVNVFGLTETGCTSIIYRAEGEQSYTRYLPNGRPLSNTLIYILDDHLNPVPQGVSGELCIGGMSVGLGYVGEA